MKNKIKITPAFWTLAGIPVIFLIGSLFHFLYDLTGQNPFAAAISAVNESVWEHTKMVVLPVLLWWLSYLLIVKPEKAAAKRWLTSSLAAFAAAWITIPMLFYFYTNAFGVELLWVDILILLIAVIIGQLFGLHLLKHGSGTGFPIPLSLFLWAAILIIFAVFTFCTPELPLFQDLSSGNYQQ